MAKKKIKKYKVGIDSETYAISLVDMPAIESDFVALAKQEEEKKQILLEKDEKHLVVGAALIPDKDIYRYDGENEYYISFTKESIEKMSQEFLKEYRQNEVTLDHEDYASEVTVVESWLVADSYKDKSNALGINVPEGTWMVAMKVNNIETWERIKKGELNGFSVESMISLEEFNKQTKNDTEMTNDEQMNLFKKFKEWLSSTKEEEIKDAFLESAATTPMDFETLAALSGFTSVEEYKAEVEAIKEELEEEPQPTAVEEPTVVEEPKPTVEEPTVVEEPKPIEEPTQVEEPTVEETPKVDENLAELIKSLKDEINALKEMNDGLNDKVKELSKEPSVKPVNTNAKPNGGGSNYEAWRETMRSYLR